MSAAAADDSRHWFPVRSVFELDDLGDLWDLAGEEDLANYKSARSMLSQLWKAVHSTSGLYFYEELEQDVERVLDVFIRVNSAGTVLSYSDLLLSIATAQWKDRDARGAVHGLVDALNSTGKGFNFSQDVVLKSGLVLAGINDIAFKVKNFTTANMATLDECWDAISASLKVAAGLLSDFGLSTATLSANSVLIPIAHYVHRRGLTQQYRESPAQVKDRAALRSWTLRSLIIPGVWGSGLDTLLRDLREAINEHGEQGFPTTEIEPRMAVRGKSLAVTAEQVEDILNVAYGSPRAFAVLATLFPHVNTRNVHHVDHVFPYSQLATPKLKAAGLDAEAIADVQTKRNQLPNLQLLEGLENIAKSAKIPQQWAAAAYPTVTELQAYLERNDIPKLAANVDEFESCFEQRRQSMRVRIAATLGAAATADIALPDSVSISASLDADLAESDSDV